MSTNKENRLIHPPIKTWQYFIIFLGILLLWLLNWILPIACMDDWSEIGNFGSMFGAVNTLFSGFAFALLIIAIYLQRHEIKIQHEELKNQNQELKNQNYELGLTREVFEQQKFESTFFKLIEMYWKYYGELVYEGTHANFSGISAVNGNLNEINRLIKHPNSIEKKIPERARIKNLFEQSYDFTTPYLKAVKGLFAWIDEAEKKKIDLAFYKTFAKDLFSENEKILLLIFLNSLEDNEFIILLTKFDLFDEIEEHDPTNKSHVYLLYKIYREELQQFSTD